MSRTELKKKINKKLKDKWGYSRHQIAVYWQMHKDLSIEDLELELKNI